MGKHSQPQKCGGCNGSGKEIKSDDGNRREIPCTLCNGTGKV
ncbi:Uncharacterised protein [Mycobacterium tuberculosis]|nr:Uncharacterised protein [Mycobacterium tuberculosis]